MTVHQNLLLQNNILMNYSLGSEGGIGGLTFVESAYRGFCNSQGVEPLWGSGLLNESITYVPILLNTAIGGAIGYLIGNASANGLDIISKGIKHIPRKKDNLEKSVRSQNNTKRKKSKLPKIGAGIGIFLGTGFGVAMSGAGYFVGYEIGTGLKHFS